MTELGSFQPTHFVPESGLGAWHEPDGGQPVAAWLQPGTEVCVSEWQGAWAHALFSNGWQAWIDGRQLRPCQAQPASPTMPPPAPAEPAPPPVWQPTNVVGAAGLPAWTDPDATQQPAARIDPGVEVAVTERMDNGWAHIACANGWSAWVDGRQLLQLQSAGAAAMPPSGFGAAAPPAPPAARQTAFGIAAPSWWPAEIPLVAGAGAVLIIVGSFLPWVTFGPFSASGWDVSLGYLITGGDGITGGLKVGFVLLLSVVVALPALTHKPLPEWVVPAVGGVAVLTSGVTLVRALTASTSSGLSTMSLSPSIGLFVTLAAGIVILVDWFR